MVRAVATKKAVSSPKTIARVTFCAGVTVLSRTVVTTRSMLSTASVVQSLMAPRPVREPGERTWPRPVCGASGQVDGRDRPSSAALDLDVTDLELVGLRQLRAPDQHVLA